MSEKDIIILVANINDIDKALENAWQNAREDKASEMVKILKEKARKKDEELMETFIKGISVRYSIGGIRVTKEAYENWVRLK